MGAVQGVGFRPFVYRLAKELAVTGFIQNSPDGISLEAEGDHESLNVFLLRLQKEKPAIASIYNLEYSVHDPAGYEDFSIINSEQRGKISTTVLPDIAICKDCLQELFDPENRRYRYPFINCTNCGPRFSIINTIPYDRDNTSMKVFAMCSECQKEYDDPNNRRFHAQPNACPVCGPSIELWDSAGKIIAENNDALIKAAEMVREGKIIAFKGIGGFQLMTDARNKAAVEELRKRKHRNEKPFALMYPSLETIKQDCHVSVLEERLLLSVASPIVLLERKDNRKDLIAENIAPGNPYLGAMLPCTPLHHLLMYELGFPIVATSGNLNDEPICIDEYEALERLKGIADLFLVHDRAIVRQVDDSVVRVVAGREQVLRKARGYAPLPIHLNRNLPPMLAVGAHLKNTIAISTGEEIFISQHIGDLETEPAFAAFQKVIGDFKELYEVEPSKVISDLHPEYLSSKYAKEINDDVITIQHHYAHVLSCMADNEIEGNVLGVSWDGTGSGTDGTIWGSEFLLTSESGFERVAHFRNFYLPGGEAAVKQPRRTAVGLLYEMFGENVFDRTDLIPVQSFSEKDLQVIQQMLKKKINSPVTCSAGRLFDAVASIIGSRQEINFEGQAAIELEFLIDKSEQGYYPFEKDDSKESVIDWQPMIMDIISDMNTEADKGAIAAKFHNTLVEMIVRIAHKIKEQRIVLTGGCFQNKYLTERTVMRLTEEGFQPYWHQRIPPNDGGISVGQIMAARPPKSPEGEPGEDALKKSGYYITGDVV